MASSPKINIGTMACLCCGEPMPVKQGESGTLDLSCKSCDFSAYAKPGTTAHLLALRRVTRRPGQAPEPAPKPVPAPVAVVEAKPKAKPAQMPALPSAAVIKKNTVWG